MRAPRSFRALSWPAAAAIVSTFWLCCTTAAACTVNGTPNISLGSKTSFEVASVTPNAGSGASGLACSGILGLLSNQYIYISVSSSTGVLTHSTSGDTIGFSIATIPSGAPLAAGTTSGNLATSGLLSLSGANGEAALFVNLGAAGNVAAGTYSGTVTLRWHYAVCTNISALGICIGSWTRSAGIDQSCVLSLCTLNTASLPGAGTPVTLTISLQITQDCRFDADQIDFGAAPFVDSFSAVSGQLRITCTKGATYTVGLSEGGFASGGRRRMSSGAQYLQYDVFRPGNTVWNGTDRRVAQSTPAMGNVAETFPYEARIYLDQPTPPVGTYSDTLIIDVAF